MPKTKPRPVKTIRYELRISDEEHREWSHASIDARRTLAQWIRDTCNARTNDRKVRS